MALAPGTNVGPYRIVEQLGRGGMASVYRGYEAALDRDVAVKVLPPEFLHDPAFAERFRREAKAVARLEHPNIIPIHAFGIESGVPWMAMRLVPGGALSGLLKKERLEARRVVGILHGVAAALDYAHSKGTVHRDVKPQNVLLDADERAYLADFGIARMVEGSSALTATGMISGTPHYMSPEQAQGQTVDHRTDLYALGIVAYEMLTGKVPYAADTPVAVLLKHVTEPLPIPAQMDFPELAVRAILKCVAKKPQDRWPTARAFVEALEKGLQGTATPAAPQAAPGTMTLSPAALEAVTGESAAPPPLAPARPANVPVERAPSSAWPLAALAATGLVVALAVAWFVLRRPQAPVPADRSAAVVVPFPPGEDESPAAAPSTEAPRRREPGAPTIPVGTDPRPAKLAIDFDHGFKSGSLRVIVDDEPALVRRLEGRAKKKLVAFKGWQGSVDEVLDLPPGPHTIRVQVAWDDNVRTATIRGQFAPDATRHLDISVGGLKKNLSLEWK